VEKNRALVGEIQKSQTGILVHNFDKHKYFTLFVSQKNRVLKK